MTTTSPTAKQPGSTRVAVQRFGTFLSGMIMPNIPPALIAWGGIFTAFFIPVGWTPNADLSTIVGPMIHYLLPILIAYTGGHMVHGLRGAVVGSIATFGVIAGSDNLIALYNAALLKADPNAAPLGQIHMFIGGAMIMAPPRGVHHEVARQPVGREDPQRVRDARQHVLCGHLGLRDGGHRLLPDRVAGQRTDEPAQRSRELARVEPPPAAHQHPHRTREGVLPEQRHQPRRAHPARTGAGRRPAAQVDPVPARGQPPAPGVGLLLAFTIFGIGAARASAPGAAVIQFVGGIHEVYFPPYALMKPTLILALIAGGMTGVTTNVLFNDGLRRPRRREASSPSSRRPIRPITSASSSR